MALQHLRIALVTIFLLVPRPCIAQQPYDHVVRIQTGVNSSIPVLLAGIVNILFAWSGAIATGLFLLGCMMVIISGGSDQLLSSGKRIMKASLIGFVLVLSSWMLLSTVIYFIGG